MGPITSLITSMDTDLFFMTHGQQFNGTGYDFIKNGREGKGYIFSLINLGEIEQSDSSNLNQIV